MKRYEKYGRKAGWIVKDMENMEANWEKIWKIRKNSEKIKIWKIWKKFNWIFKWYGKYGRKVSWNVKWYGKYGRKISWIVKRYEKYGRKVGWIVKILKIWKKLGKDMENTEE